ncbi:hypothetical protein KUW19_00230 [Ferrimonas balearica]|uniref:hypothetical protein n=1 Tax=Ferrimonas balearica TaxID=44012 RepID=UPI001C962669|nr:hypothetical protein [Ferrimonas balearica]MBY6104908.1 hypothetical protein [Ferrimonas balearica]
MSRNEARFVLRAEDATSRAFGQVERNLAALRTAAAGAATALGGIGAASVAMGGAALAAVSQLAQQGREIEQNALKAGVGVEQMQALAYASEQYNIQGEQFADIIKDANDKIGDFIATGGGELADFFENIAPQVGVTADEMLRLSGPEVLVRFKQALDDAGLSAKEQVVYLEALANDASTLTPLLAENGRELERLSGSFDELNASLSATDIANLKAMDQQFKDMAQTLKTSFAQAVVGAGDQIDWMNDKVAYALRWWGGFFDTMRDEPRTLDGMISKMGDLREELQGLENSRADAVYMKTGELVSEARARIERDLAALMASYNAARFGMAEPTPLGITLTEAPEDMYRPNGGGNSATTEAERAALEDLAAARERAALAGLDAEARLTLQHQTQLDQLDELAAAHPRLADEVAGARAAVIAGFEREHAKLGDLEQQRSEREQAAIDKQIAAVADSLKSEAQLRAEAWAVQQGNLEQWLADGHLTEERYNQLSIESKRQYYEEMAEIAEESAKEQAGYLENLYLTLAESQEGVGDLFEDTVSRFSEGMGQALEQAVFDSENLGDAIGGVFENMGRSMVAFFGEWAAQRMAMWLLEQMIGTAEGGGYVAEVGARGAAETQLGALNAAASIAAIPIIGPGLAPAAAATFAAFGAGLTAAAVGAASGMLAGAAHGGLGYVPNESTYLLQRGERVLSPRQNQDLTQFINGGGGGGNNINITGTDPAAIAREVDRVLSRRNKRRDTRIAKAATRGRLNQGIR